jgi:hypothetical protein
VITNKSCIKAVFAIGKPTDANVHMAITFNNQLVTVDDVIQQDIEELKCKNKDVTIKEWTSHTGTNTSHMPDCILLHSGQLYSVSLNIDCACGPYVNGDLGQVPKSVEQALQGKRAKIMKHSLEKTTVAPGESIKRVVQKKAITTLGDMVVISMNDFYDLSILQDYGSEVFHHENASLRQLDSVRDVDNKLIHLKDWYSVLRRGTLVMARGMLHAYNWEGRCVCIAISTKRRKSDGQTIYIYRCINSVHKQSESSSTRVCPWSQ